MSARVVLTSIDTLTIKQALREVAIHSRATADVVDASHSDYGMSANMRALSGRCDELRERLSGSTVGVMAQRDVDREHHVSSLAAAARSLQLKTTALGIPYIEGMGDLLSAAQRLVPLSAEPVSS